jgi:hypothetical protein
MLEVDLREHPFHLDTSVNGNDRVRLLHSIDDEPASVEAAGAATLRADLRPLPSLPQPEKPLVREGLCRPHRRLRF